MSARTPGAVHPLGLPGGVPPTVAASARDGCLAATTAAPKPTDADDAVTVVVQHRTGWTDE